MPFARRPAALLPLALALLACAPERRVMTTGAPPELRFYRELPIEAPGGDIPAMLADPGGGLWVAVPGLPDGSSKSRLFHRAPGGAWKTVYEGPFATEPSLSSTRAGKVWFGFNLPLDGFRPSLLAVTPDHVEPLPAPDDRLDAIEFLQVGSYAMRSDSEGVACGQRGARWRMVEGRWTREPDVLPWKPGDPAAQSYCQSIQLVAEDRGFISDFDGNGAIWDGRAWRLVDRGAPPSRFFLGGGLAQEGRAILRWDGATFVRLAGELPADGHPLRDPAGRWLAQRDRLVEVGPTAIRALSGRLPFAPTALADADGALFMLAEDGVYRGTRRDLPTFVPAPEGAAPIGVAYGLALDLDGDGDEDLLGLVARSGENVLGAASLVAHLNDGAGHFTAASLGLPRNVRLWRDRVDAGDVDGDGDLDVVAATIDGRVELYRNELGRFRRVFAREAPDATVALVDVDRDGDLDLSLIPAEPALLLNDGVGGFGEERAAPRPASRVERATWEDVDGDGDADAVLQHWRDPAHLLINEGASFRLAELPVVAEGATWADLDHDGAPELLAQKIHLRNLALPFARCRFEGSACAADGAIEIPAGIVIDLNLDGVDDVIGADLRGDEAKIADGEVWLGARDPSGKAASFERITDVSGAMPRPTVIDADGDGDPDVYSTAAGLRLNTADPTSFIRVRLDASRSDRRARGARVIAKRRGDGAIVASARADLGVVMLGLPDRAASYDVEVRFPAGERRTLEAVAAGSELVVRDAGPAAFAARLGLLWIQGTARRAQLLRDVALPIAALLAFAAIARRRRRADPRPALAFAAIAWLPLAGALLRAGDAAPWLIAPSVLGTAALTHAALAAWAHQRSRRRAGPYLLLEELGAGAAATVWRARFGKSEVALKIFSAESMTQSESRERFFREARIGGEIDHPNVVKIRDSGRLDDGRCYLAMELVAGRSLADVLVAREKLLPAEAASIGRDVARALEALHGAGIVHRDVKPENIMVRPDGTAVLTDLGLARSALFRTLTRHDVAVGTLAYMSPEQCVGRPLDGRSDIWSLGVVLYEMLTGRRPFLAEHELELVYVIHNVDPPPPSSIVNDVPAALDAVTRRCLAREVDERFASAVDLAAALDAATPRPEPIAEVGGPALDAARVEG